MQLVIDCSIVMAWCFDDETDDYADSVLEQMHIGEAFVPEIWALEVTNVLVVAERKKRISRTASQHFINLVKTLPIKTDRETSETAWSDILTLARTYQLSTYDASYLELAIRRGIPLASNDRALRTATKKSGASLFAVR